MRRRLFNLATVLSLLLCVATVVLWVNDVGPVEMHLPNRNLILWHYSGDGLGVRLFTNWGPEFEKRILWDPGDTTYVRRYGFSYYRRELVGIGLDREVSIPCWIPSAALLLVAVAMFRHIRKTRRLEGHCTACSYDLAGNISGVCPECGWPIAEERGAKS